MDSDCYRTKERLSREDYLRRASAASGMAAQEEGKSYHEYTKFEYYDSQDNLATILKAGCPNLRLRFEHDNHARNNEGKINTLAGFPDALIVCDKRSGYCTCLRGLEQIREVERSTALAADAPGDEDESPMEDESLDDEDAAPAEGSSEPKILTVGDLETAAREARAAKRQASKLAGVVKRLAAERLGRALEERSAAAWRLMADKMMMVYSRDQIEKLDFAALCVAFGERTVQRIMPFDPKSLGEILTRVNRSLGEAGVPPVSEAEVHALAGK